MLVNITKLKFTWAVMDNVPLSFCSETNSVVLCLTVSMLLLVASTLYLWHNLVNYGCDLNKSKYYKQ